jgi:hypothetical protein
MWLQVQSMKIRPLTTCSGLVRKLEKEFHVSLCVISLVSMWRDPTQNYQLDRWDIQVWKDLGIIYKNRCNKMTPPKLKVRNKFVQVQPILTLF